MAGPHQQQTVGFESPPRHAQEEDPAEENDFMLQNSPTSALFKQSGKHRSRAQTYMDEMDFIQPPPPTPQLHMELISTRFVVFVGLAVAFSACFNAVFLKGVTVESNILEEIGSSTKANDSVEKFNTISGYVMAFVGLALDIFYGCFFNAFVVYLHNLPWYRGDDPDQVDSSTTKAAKVIRVGLFLFAFVVPFALKNSFSSLQAGQETVGFDHVMTYEDLSFQDPLRYIPKSNKSSQVAKTNSMQLTGKSIEATILKNALREETVPFSFDTKSECVRKLKASKKGNSTNAKLQLKVQDLAATAVVYGFSPKEWNREMLPNELTYSFSDTVTFGDYLNDPTAFSTKFDMATALEMVLQGKTIFERAITDSNQQTYNCSDSDAREDLDMSPNDPWLVERRKQLAQEQAQTHQNGTSHTNSSQGTNHHQRRLMQNGDASGDEEWELEGSGNADFMLDDEVPWTYDINTGKRLCSGVVSSLYDLRDYKNKDNHNLEYVLNAIAVGLEDSVPALGVADTSVTFEKYQINDQIELETIRVDLQMDANVTYGHIPSECFSNSTNPNDPDYLSPEGKEVVCHPSLYLYLDKADFCGSKNCVFLDGSKTFTIRKEVSMIPYMKNCDTNKLQYDEDYGNFFPTGCKMQHDSVFVYGLGSYISGSEFGSDFGGYGFPYILDPRRHIRMTFAKMSWQTRDLPDKFDAECSTNETECTGLAHKLEPSGRYLFLGEHAIPTRRLNQSGFHQPIPLVRLNSREVFVSEFNDSVDLERINPENFNVTKWDASKNETLKEENCSMLMDSFMNQIENNNYILEKPLQVMYTSALLFLFQDAGITQVNDTKLLGKPEVMAKGLAKDKFYNLKLNGDETVREIRVKVPLSSAITTFAGCGVILSLMICVLGFPTRRLRFLPGATMAEEFIEMHTETYSELIHEKSFKFETGEAVPTSDYHAECVTLLHAEDRDQCIKLS